MSNSERGRLITVHGIDGTGKTTVAAGVSEVLKQAGLPAINYDNFKSGKENPHAARKEEADKIGTVEERLAVYLESMMYHSQQIEDLLRQGYHVVKSRYVDDVCAHFAHLGIPAEKMRLFKEKFPIVQPDLKVLLTLDEHKRRQRIEDRGVLDEKDLDEKKPGSRIKFFEDYLLEVVQNAPKNSVLHLDSGNLDADAVVKKIVDHLMSQI